MEIINALYMFSKFIATIYAIYSTLEMLIIICCLIITFYYLYVALAKLIYARKQPRHTMADYDDIVEDDSLCGLGYDDDDIYDLG